MNELLRSADLAGFPGRALYSSESVPGIERLHAIVAAGTTAADIAAGAVHRG